MSSPRQKPIPASGELAARFSPKPGEVKEVRELGLGISRRPETGIDRQDGRAKERVGALDIAIAGEIAAGDQDHMLGALGELPQQAQQSGVQRPGIRLGVGDAEHRITEALGEPRGQRLAIVAEREAEDMG